MINVDVMWLIKSNSNLIIYMNIIVVNMKFVKDVCCVVKVLSFLEFNNEW